MRMTLSLLCFVAPVVAAQNPPPPRPAPHRDVPKVVPVPMPDVAWDLKERLFDQLEPMLAPEGWMAFSDQMAHVWDGYSDLAWSGLEFSMPDFEYVMPHIEWPDLAPGVTWDVTPGYSDLVHAAPLLAEPWVEVHPAPAPDVAWSESRLHRKLSLPEPGPGSVQDTSEAAMYRQAREYLNKGEYRKALTQLEAFQTKYPQSRYVPASMYWQAFALYRTGADAELRRALQVLDQQRTRYPAAAEDEDVAALYMRVMGTLASRGDAGAQDRIRQGALPGGSPCDKEEMAVRSEALSALMQTDPTAARQALERVLQRQDECSAPLRRRAVYLLGRQEGTWVVPRLSQVARTDPENSVKSDAVSQLGRIPGAASLQALREVFPSADERTQRSIMSAMSRREEAEAREFLKQVIQNESLSDNVRAEAIRAFARGSSQYAIVSGQGVATVSGRTLVVTGQQGDRPMVVSTRENQNVLTEADATFLRELYPRLQARALKSAVIEALVRAGGQANDDFLMAIARNPNEETRYRTAALSRLRRPDVPIEQLVRLYDSMTEREMRSSIISALGRRDEDAATDKLLEIARNGTDPTLRRQAISALTRKDDPRTTRLLLELLEP